MDGEGKREGGREGGRDGERGGSRKEMAELKKKKRDGRIEQEEKNVTDVFHCMAGGRTCTQA